jgi:hypothetical protein
MGMILPAVLAVVGTVAAVAMMNKQKTPPLPPPTPPLKQPIRLGDTAARERATLLTAKPAGAGVGLSPPAVGAGTSPTGAVTRPSLLGQ